MFTDNELNRLEGDLKKNLEGQGNLSREIDATRERIEREKKQTEDTYRDNLRRIEIDWGSKLKRLEEDFRRLQADIPRITDKIEARKSQVQREQEKKAA